MGNKVLIFNGSPRKKGNSNFLAGKVTEGILAADKDAKIEAFNLHAMDIEPCRACNACRTGKREGKYCVIRDDMAGIYEKLVKSRAIVLVTPIYWFTVTAQTKLFIDRLYGLHTEKTKSLKDKPIGIVLVYGDADADTSGVLNAIGALESSFGYTGSTIKGIVHGSANKKGDAEKNAALCESAYNLGKTLL